MNWGLSEKASYRGAQLDMLEDGIGGAHLFTQDEFGRQASRLDPGGASHEKAWDAIGRSTGYVLRDASGRPVVQRRVEWSDDDTVVAVDIVDRGQRRRDAFQYDAAGRLTGWSRDGALLRDIDLDEADNLIREPHGPARQYDADRLIGDANGVLYRHDAMGRLVSENDAGTIRRRWFDAFDRLTRVQTDDDTLIHHRYDALGRRIETTAEYPDARVCTEQFTYDGDLLARRVIWDSARPETQRDETYTFDPEQREPLYRVVRGGKADDSCQEIQYYTVDQRGAAVRLSRGDGECLWSGDPDPHGLYTEGGPEARCQPLRLAGQVHDAHSGLSHHRYRVYDPRTRRFLTRDPLGLTGGPNLYAYPADPISWADPLGLAGCRWDDGMQRWRDVDGRFTSRPDDVARLVGNGGIDHPSLMQWLNTGGNQQRNSNTPPVDGWAPSALFPSGGFRYDVDTPGGSRIRAHGHGQNPNAVANHPGSNAANGPTTTIRSSGNGQGQTLQQNGAWANNSSSVNPNDIHIPLENSPY